MAQKISTEITEKVKTYIDILRKEIPVSLVYVFGSHSQGTARKDSDIDVAIISPAFGERRIEDGTWLNMKLWESPYKNMDVVGYSPEYFAEEDSPLIHEIKKHGILVE